MNFVYDPVMYLQLALGQWVFYGLVSRASRLEIETSRGRILVVM